MFKHISTKDMLAIVASTDIDSSAAWDPEFATDVIKAAKLLSIEMDKLEHVVDDPKLIVVTLNAMKDAERTMARLQAYFKSYRSKYSYIAKTSSLDSIPSTIEGEIEEHGDDFDHGTPIQS